MEINYFNDTDTLLLVFSKNPVIETKDLGENVLVDLDDAGHPVALTIEHAQSFTNIRDVSFRNIMTGQTA